MGAGENKSHPPRPRRPQTGRSDPASAHVREEIPDQSSDAERNSRLTVASQYLEAALSALPGRWGETPSSRIILKGRRIWPQMNTDLHRWQKEILNSLICVDLCQSVADSSSLDRL